jgi:hypothetical protein
MGLISLALRAKEKPHGGKFATNGTLPSPRNFRGRRQPISYHKIIVFIKMFCIIED